MLAFSTREMHCFTFFYIDNRDNLALVFQIENKVKRGNQILIMTFLKHRRTTWAQFSARIFSCLWCSWVLYDYLIYLSLHAQKGSLFDQNQILIVDYLNRPCCILRPWVGGELRLISPSWVKCSPESLSKTEPGLCFALASWLATDDALSVRLTIIWLMITGRGWLSSSDHVDAGWGRWYALETFFDALSSRSGLSVLSWGGRQLGLRLSRCWGCN